MARDERSLEQDTEQSVGLAQQLCALIVAGGEPLELMQSMKWELVVMQAQLDALRDMLMAKGGMDTLEYQRRFKDRLAVYNGLMQEKCKVKAIITPKNSGLV
ncbi:MAG: hypothetical protein WC822_02365 [Candidatus Paceibacterota bacterium]|jgi:hypothetical protein